MYADAGVKLSTSTLNDWVHRTAGKLYPLYETLIDDTASYIRFTRPLLTTSCRVTTCKWMKSPGA